VSSAVRLKKSLRRSRTWQKVINGLKNARITGKTAIDLSYGDSVELTESKLKEN
jgi:hypothetical protein